MDFILWNQKVVRAQYLLKYLILRKWSEKKTNHFNLPKFLIKTKISLEDLYFEGATNDIDPLNKQIFLWNDMPKCLSFFMDFKFTKVFMCFSKSMRVFLFLKIKFNLHANKLQIFCENKCDIYLLCSLRNDMTVKKFHWPINILTYFISRV